MKKTEFQVKKGILPVFFTRGVEINNRASVLTVELKLNHKKGLHTIIGKLNHDQITGNKTEDEATINTLCELMDEARKYAIEWRTEWEKAKEDPNQLSMLDVFEKHLNLPGGGGFDDTEQGEQAPE